MFRCCAEANNPCCDCEQFFQLGNKLISSSQFVHNIYLQVVSQPNLYLPYHLDNDMHLGSDTEDEDERPAIPVYHQREASVREGSF